MRAEILSYVQLNVFHADADTDNNEPVFIFTIALISRLFYRFSCVSQFFLT